MNIDITYNWTDEQVRRAMKGFYRLHLQASPIWFLLLGFIVFGCGLFSLVYDGMEIANVIMLVIGITLIVYPLFIFARIAKKAREMLSLLDSDVSFNCDGKSVLVRSKHGEECFSCNELKKCVITEEFIYLFFQKHVCMFVQRYACGLNEERYLERMKNDGIAKTVSLGLR